MRVLEVALLVGLGTFAGVAAAQTPQRLPATVTTEVPNVLTVQNQRKVPVVVYMEFGSFDRRLGEAPALQMTNLSLPAWAVKGQRRIRLFVHPEGQVEDLATQEFNLAPAGRVSLLVPPRGGAPRTTPARDVMHTSMGADALAATTLTVNNERGTAVTVYARQSDIDTRLGRVAAGEKGTLRVPSSLVGPGDAITIFVHPDGGDDLKSESVVLKKGQHVGLTVPVR